MIWSERLDFDDIGVATGGVGAHGGPAPYSTGHEIRPNPVSSGEGGGVIGVVSEIEEISRRL